jgi:bifunctional oligoribonuclease and PAP phosphatase NrnA
MEAPNNSLEELAERLRLAERIVVIAHVRPDGDAIGSVLGLTLSLRALGKVVIPLLEDPVPENLAFLPHSDEVTAPAELIEADLVVALDTANQERVGKRCLEILSGIKDWINMDHHVTNPGYGTLNHIDPGVPATGQLVYELLRVGGFPVTDAIRQNLYVAISTDTGSFQYPGTGSRTHEIAAEMLAEGLDAGRLCRLTYETFPARRLHLLRALLNEMALSMGGRVASWQYTQKTAREAGAMPGDTEGLIDTLRMVDSVIAAVIFEELPDGKIRVSARSKTMNVNVSEICGRFGGGGHPLAAGARMAGPIDQAAARYLEELENEVRRHD